MSRADVQHEILEPMQQLFLPPRQMAEAQQVAALIQYVDALAGYSREVLAAAWSDVRAAHLRASWPPIAALMAAARAAKRGGEGPAIPVTISLADGHAERQRRFQRFCEHRGIAEHKRAALLRPNLWWLRPRDEWGPDWRENEVPFGQAPNMRNRDGSMAGDTRLG